MLAPCFIGTSKETGGLLGAAEKGTKERLQVPRRGGESSLRIRVLWEPVELYFF